MQLLICLRYLNWSLQSCRLHEGEFLSSTLLTHRTQYNKNPTNNTLNLVSYEEVIMSYDGSVQLIFCQRYGYLLLD
jgi:hypothetical protein